MDPKLEAGGGRNRFSVFLRIPLRLGTVALVLWERFFGKNQTFTYEGEEATVEMG